MTREAREKLLLELLQAGWKKANTFDVTPHISFGWFDESKSTPQVTIGQPEESPTGGGNTGYSHIRVGEGPGQSIIGTMPVHVWSTHERLSSAGATTSNPREFNERCCEEVKRIVRANASTPTNPSTGAEPVSSIAYDGREPVPEPDRPEVEHYATEVRYTYED